MYTLSHRIDLFLSKVAVLASKGREAHLVRAKLLLVEKKPPLQSVKGPLHCTTADYMAPVRMMLGGETENT